MRWPTLEYVVTEIKDELNQGRPEVVRRVFRRQVFLPDSWVRNHPEVCPVNEMTEFCGRPVLEIQRDAELRGMVLILND